VWRQPKAVWAVAFASVIAFMGIGLVDPILKPIADQLDATPSQVSLLFTSYMAVMGVAMLITGAVASRIGAKRTLLIGLVVIIVGAGLAGSSSSIMEIVGWRALWGLGNALFVATAHATIVSSARGSVAQAVILYETASVWASP
jgi:ACDE family multidrug resistance protein